MVIDMCMRRSIKMCTYMDSSIAKARRFKVCRLISCYFDFSSFWTIMATQGSDSIEAAGSSVHPGMKREFALMMKSQSECGISDGQKRVSKAQEGCLIDGVTEAKRAKQEQNLGVEAVEVVTRSDREGTEKGVALSHEEEPKNYVLEGEDRLIENYVGLSEEPTGGIIVEGIHLGEVREGEKGVEAAVSGDVRAQPAPKGKNKSKIAELKKIPRKLKELLETGLLEGLSVRYVRGSRAKGPSETGLRGTIKGSGVLCYCDNCDGKEVVTPNQFELHAGSLNRRPPEYIYLENGNTLRDILNVCKSASVDSMAVAIQNAVGCSSANKLTVCTTCKGPIVEAGSGRTKLSCDSCMALDAPQSSLARMTDRSSECVSNRKSSGRVASSNPPSKSQGPSTRKDLGKHKAALEELVEGTVLSYRANGEKRLEGHKSGIAIFCYCCKTEVSPSQFEAHAGCASRRSPYRHIFTPNGFSLHQLANIRSQNGERSAGTKGSTHIVETCEFDLSACALCRKDDFSKSGFGPRTVIICDQCEKEYHIGCLKEHNMEDLEELPDDEWFCCAECKGIHLGLENLVAKGEMKLPEVLLDTINKKHAANGPDENLDLDIRWRLFQGKSGDEEAEKWLSGAVTLFREQFAPIVDGKSSRLDLVPCMVFGRENGDQDYGAMHTAVLIINSVVVSAAIFRIFDQQVAELPLVATKSDYQGLGYFQSLFYCIENTLGSLNVRDLVLPSAEKAKSIWINKFGFEKIPEEQLIAYQEFCPIMAFRGTTMLHKAVPKS